MRFRKLNFIQSAETHLFFKVPLFL